MAATAIAGPASTNAYAAGCRRRCKSDPPGQFSVGANKIIQPTQRNTAVTTDALYDFSIDRSAGTGRGWLFQFTLEGQLLAKTKLTDGVRYHPGGIDYDGTNLWVPVAEYRPNSSATIYRVDPRTLVAERVLGENDHIGGVVFNRATGKLHGVS